ncbi:unnamed protein product [Allacma fusca]|uniref:CCAAT-binding factor domain-containing protein n=1 Tax=Allacma fusca TaxID=39272 RepID=A0A8J2K076_9HEXA|nr:unnamed protein product [Allacma fusca]
MKAKPAKSKKGLKGKDKKLKKNKIGKGGAQNGKSNGFMNQKNFNKPKKAKGNQKSKNEDGDDTWEKLPGPNPNNIIKFNSHNNGGTSSYSKTTEDSSLQNTKLVIKSDGQKWFKINVPGVESSTNSKPEGEETDVKPLLVSEINTIENAASKYLEADVEAYSAANLNGPGRSDFLWMNKMMKTGTLPDRMAAFTVRIQDSPVHNLNCLQQLIGQVKIQGKQHCLMTAETVKDLFLQDLLPPDRKLQTFANHDVALRKAPKKQIILWLFEDRLKKCYLSYVEALGKMSGDTIDTLRGKAISIIQQLITTHPEQESVLLPMLVNKLGDPVQKVASRALFHLEKLVKAHPRMKMVVVEEVERLLFRNNVGSKAQYYGICFLNMVQLQEEHPKLAAKLVKLYLAFFKACIKKGEIDSKMMSALLTGVNKAFKKAQLVGVEIIESVDTLYKIVRLSQFNIGIQALSLLLQMSDVKDDPAKADRFYRILYEKLLSSEVGTTAHGMKFLNLLHRALRADTNIIRVTAFAKRLLQVCHHVPANIACGILFLLSEVCKEHRGIFKLGSSPSSTGDVSTKSSPNDDGSDTEKESEATRETKRKALEKLLKKTNVTTGDADEKQIQAKPVSKIANKLLNIATEKQNPIKSQSNDDEVQEVEVEEKHVPVVKIEPTEIRATTYDISGRNPAYCGANLTLAFELVSLAEHYHPSVALFAQTLIDKNFIKYDGNPLRDFAIARFLERFIYRNPKVNKLRPQYEPRGLRKVPVNSTTYLEADVSKVPIEERFFYKYFKDRKYKAPVKKDDDADSDLESVGDEEFEEIMGNYFKQSGALASDDDDEEDDIDFAANIKTVVEKKNKKGKSKIEDEEDDDDDEEDEPAVFDDDMEGAYDNSDLDDEEAIDADDFVELGDDADNDFNLDDDFEGFDTFEDDEAVTVGKTKINKKSKLKSLGGDKMFLPAEQFSEMLDENADLDLGSAHTFINKDRADMKQLKWESDRDRWVKGYKKTSKTSFKSQKSKKRKKL